MKNSLIIKDQLDKWALENSRIKDLMLSEYGILLREAYETLDVSVLYQSHIHGSGHIERTMLLGAMIARALALPMHESRMLLLCCSYHDIGRHDDSRDDAHGEASARKLMKENMKSKLDGFSSEDINIMLAAVSLHSRSDKEIEAVAREYGIEAESLARYYTIAKCLKDSDNLDRVRLGDLDVRHLRHKESADMADDAQWILDSYNSVRYKRG